MANGFIFYNLSQDGRTPLVSNTVLTDISHNFKLPGSDKKLPTFPHSVLPTTLPNPFKFQTGKIQHTKTSSESDKVVPM